MKNRNIRRGHTQEVVTKTRNIPEVVSGSSRSMKGFTLIELLVVVLIIGILAAVAVPQYQLAVVKSRVATMLPLVTTMMKAQELFFLSEGRYTTDSTLLDISMPAECTLVEGGEEGDLDWKCGEDFLIDFSTFLNGVYLNYCPGKNTDFSTCKDHRDFIIIQYFQHSVPSKIMTCSVKNNSALGQKICNSLAYH